MENGKKTDFYKHVCGENPANAHYIDAVTAQKHTPWYDLKDHNIYKLTTR